MLNPCLTMSLLFFEDDGHPRHCRNRPLLQKWEISPSFRHHCLVPGLVVACTIPTGFVQMVPCRHFDKIAVDRPTFDREQPKPTMSYCSNIIVAAVRLERHQWLPNEYIQVGGYSIVQHGETSYGVFLHLLPDDDSIKNEWICYPTNSPKRHIDSRGQYALYKLTHPGALVNPWFPQITNDFNTPLSHYTPYLSVHFLDSHRTSIAFRKSSQHDKHDDDNQSQP